VMVDAATRVCRIKATKNCDSVSAANAILTEWIARVGIPQCIRSDNGTQFANQIVEALCEALHIHHHFIIPYQPQSNGIVERLNGEIIKHLRCLLLDADQTTMWSSQVPFLEFILNNSVHSALASSPNAMLYGNMLPNQYDFPRMIAEYDGTHLEKKAKEYIKSLQDSLLLIHATAQRAQAQALQKRDERYNSNVAPTEYQVGDFVLLKHTHDDVPPKLSSLWLGPYKLIEILAPQTYRIQSLYDPTCVQDVHHMRLIPFHMRPDVSTDLLKDLAERDKGEFLVDRVVAHDGFNKRNIRFKVHWLGYSDDKDTWQSWSDVEGNVKVQEYIRANPELLHLLREPKRR